MIETDEVKIAEDPIEAKWIGIKKSATKSIDELETQIEINKVIIKLADEKLLQFKN